jgi:archaellum component FlaC
MECWTGSFANAAGRGQLERELLEYKGIMEHAKALYDELNVENLRVEAERRAQDLANSRALSAKLTNQVKDAEKRADQARTALGNLAAGTAEYTDKEAEIAAFDLATKDLKDRKAAEEEMFATMDREDAEMSVERLAQEVESRAKLISQYTADVAFEKGLAEQYALEMADENKTAEEREFARVEEERARIEWTSKELEIHTIQELQNQITEEYSYQKDRLEGANDLLQIAEDAAAANELNKQTEVYNTLKATYDALTAELNGLYAEDDEGTITASGLKRMLEIEETYAENTEEYNSTKAALTERQTTANEKAFNKATADKAKAEVAQAAA